MTAYLTTWTASDGAHEEKFDTWSSAVGLQAAHVHEGARLTVVDPQVTTCAHCHQPITQQLMPGRWDDATGDDMCAVAGIRWHEPAGVA